ncbi:MAG: serine/threonine-protein kinase [Minicystis sp.]
MKPRIRALYEIDHLLGKGGMATVLAARDLRTGEAVAIKWLGEPGASPGDKELARFEQEARIAGSLASPYVARVFDIGRDPETGVPYLVMELLSGEDLQALLDRTGALRPEAATRIAIQTCAGLAAAHAAGVVHRDVKPSNLFLTRRDDGEIVVKVTDFGIAKIRRPIPGTPGASKALPAPPVSMTKSGEILGSPLYMSPEQVEASRRVDARSDVFSLGVSLYAMLTGRAPYAHIKSFVQLLYTIVNIPAPPLASAAPWVPVELAGVVDKAMSHDIEARFPDAKAMLAALQACAPGEVVLREEMLTTADKGSHQAVAPPPAEVSPEATTVRQEDAKASLWRRFLGLWR